MTSLAEERREQERWTARAKRERPLYGRLLENEFESFEAQAVRAEERLARVLRYAQGETPYYGTLFAKLGADPRGDAPPAVLGAMPVLSKLDVQDNHAAMRGRNLPEGERIVNWTQSSGTTGRPTHVPHSSLSTQLFAFLKHREYRWFRFDPAGTLTSIRMPGHLPRTAGGAEMADGQSGMRDVWPYMENFSTGQFIAFNATNPPEKQIEWLRSIRADYLLAYSETLEQLTFTAQGMRVCEGMKGLVAIAEDLTPDMRARIEAGFGAPVRQNYGLNEIGLVAVRCEALRYHVHSELCHVEILSDAGLAASPGETGRVVVTGLVNWAMPLIRYDTGDLAQAVDGACACGRTLPSFGEIVGRYSRIAFLPEGTLSLVGRLRSAIETAPLVLVRDLRQFQIHQFRDGRYELRLVLRGLLTEALQTYLRDAWAKAAKQDTLAIAHVDEIARGPGGKFQVFTSDYFPKPAS